MVGGVRAVRLSPRLLLISQLLLWWHSKLCAMVNLCLCVTSFKSRSSTLVTRQDMIQLERRLSGLVLHYVSALPPSYPQYGSHCAFLHHFQVPLFVPG